MPFNFGYIHTHLNMYKVEQVDKCLHMLYTYMCTCSILHKFKCHLIKVEGHRHQVKRHVYVLQLSKMIPRETVKTNISLPQF